MDWGRMRQTTAVFVGGGAVGRPLAEHLAFLGMKRCFVVDPKRYKPQSRVSQCEAEDVGRFKAEVVAARLQRLGVDAAALVEDIAAVPPGIIEPESLVLVSVDNRRADIIAGRLAAMMRTRLLKVNVAPEYLMASIRAYDLRADVVPLCVECQMTEEQYRDQRHPLSCDPGPEQPTGSPRALCWLAADAAAMAAAQIIASPEHWARRWFGRQWQQMLLGGTSAMLELQANPSCRWDHGRHWPNLDRLTVGPGDIRLIDLLERFGPTPGEPVELSFSARVATQGRCDGCHEPQATVYWLSRADGAIGTCRCGGTRRPIPFYTYDRLPLSALEQQLELPLSAWGVPPRAVLEVKDAEREASFVIGRDGSSARQLAG
jgi:hypothetical protein